MPTLPPTLCRCGGLRTNGQCNRCTAGNQRPAHKQTTRERGYGYDWQQFRKVFLAQHPLCVDCMEQGRATEAEELHHVVKIIDAPERRLDPSNVMPLCSECHDKRTCKGE